MTKPYPTYRQREVLQFLMQGGWVPILRLIPVGDKLLGNLLQAGWIERSPDLRQLTFIASPRRGGSRSGHLCR